MTAARNSDRKHPPGCGERIPPDARPLTNQRVESSRVPTAARIQRLCSKSACVLCQRIRLGVAIYLDVTLGEVASHLEGGKNVVEQTLADTTHRRFL